MSNDPGLRRLALGTLLGAFPGAVAPAWAVDLVAEGMAGHVLFGYNIVDADQVAALTAGLHAARDGVLDRASTRRAATSPGLATASAARIRATPPSARSAIRRSPAGCTAPSAPNSAAVGINLNLAPTVDVNTADDNPIIGTRSFGADPHLVAAHTAAAVLGLQSAGVAACAKHFPGHGATLADSHLELPTVDISSTSCAAASCRRSPQPSRRAPSRS